jgi:hypothetical protein
MFDPTGSGSITSTQYANALASFGVDKPTVEILEGKITKEVFIETVREELSKLAV